jgi:plastocyanin
MIRHIGVSLALAAAIAVGAAHERVAAAANGSIEGTVKAGGAAAPNAVVYIEHAQGAFTPAAATMDQRGLKFSPSVLPILVGTTVKFLNSDTTQHNVFTPDFEKYNLGTWPQGQTKDHAFAKCAKAPCVYAQLCRIHPEMEAYIVVLQNPYFAVADANGHYRIDNVPPGPYTAGAWSAKAKAPAKPVTVDAAKPVTVDFALAR